MRPATAARAGMWVRAAEFTSTDSGAVTSPQKRRRPPRRSEKLRRGDDFVQAANIYDVGLAQDAVSALRRSMTLATRSLRTRPRRDTPWRLHPSPRPEPQEPGPPLSAVLEPVVHCRESSDTSARRRPKDSDSGRQAACRHILFWCATDGSPSLALVRPCQEDAILTAGSTPKTMRKLPDITSTNGSTRHARRISLTQHACLRSRIRATSPTPPAGQHRHACRGSICHAR